MGSCYIDQHYVWGFRILNFTICLGLGKSGAIFLGIDHLQLFCGGHFQNSLFFGSIKILGIFGVLQESGLQPSVELIVVFI